MPLLALPDEVARKRAAYALSRYVETKVLIRKWELWRFLASIVLPLFLLVTRSYWVPIADKVLEPAAFLTDQKPLNSSSGKGPSPSSRLPNPNNAPDTPGSSQRQPNLKQPSDSSPPTWKAYELFQSLIIGLLSVLLFNVVVPARNRKAANYLRFHDELATNHFNPAAKSESAKSSDNEIITEAYDSRSDYTEWLQHPWYPPSIYDHKIPPFAYLYAVVASVTFDLYQLESFFKKYNTLVIIGAFVLAVGLVSTVFFDRTRLFMWLLLTYAMPAIYFFLDYYRALRKQQNDLIILRKDLDNKIGYVTNTKTTMTTLSEVLNLCNDAHARLNDWRAEQRFLSGRFYDYLKRTPKTSSEDVMKEAVKAAQKSLSDLESEYRRAYV